MRQHSLVVSLVTLSAVALVVSPANAQKGRPLLGPNVGVYFPVTGKAKDAFGSSFVNYGFGIGRLVAPGRSAQFDFNIIANRSLFQGGDKKALLIPIGSSYSYRLGGGQEDAAEEGAIPYVGLSVNIIPNNIRSDKDGINSGWRMAFGGSVFAGVAFQERYLVGVRFYGMTPVRGMNLSGWNLSAGARF